MGRPGAGSGGGRGSTSGNRFGGSRPGGGSSGGSFGGSFGGGRPGGGSSGGMFGGGRPGGGHHGGGHGGPGGPHGHGGPAPGFGGFFGGPYHRPPRRRTTIVPVFIPTGGGAAPQPSSSPPQGGPDDQGAPRKSHTGIIIAVLAVILVVLLIVGFGAGGDSGASSVSGDIPASTANRTKVDNPNSYDMDDVVDETHWISSLSTTERGLKAFYEKTGIQPYVVLKSYDASLTTDSEKNAYAEQYYDEHIDNGTSLLFMYFAEKDADTVGYMALISGNQAEAVMDTEAKDIFWAYLREYWYSDMSMDDVIIKAFDSTASRIMTKTTTSADILKWVVIAVAVIGAGIVIVVLVRQKFKRDKEKAEETERILNTPLTYSDPTLSKYENGGSSDAGATSSSGTSETISQPEGGAGNGR